MDRFITLDGLPCRLEFTEPLLGVHAPFYRSVVLLQNVVQVLDGSMSTAAAQGLILLYVGDGGAIYGSEILVDNARLWTGSIGKGPVKQALRCVSASPCR